VVRAGRLLVLLTAINLINYLDRYVVASVVEPIGEALALDDARLGRLPFVFLMVYMLSAPVFGAMGDRWHRPRVVAVAIAAWSLATMSTAFVDSYFALLVTRSLVGIGEAAYVSLGPAILADVIPTRQRAASFTWFYLAVPVGAALGYAVGGLAAVAWGWRAAFILAGAPGLVFAVWMARQSDPPRGAMDSVEAPILLGFREKMRALIGNRVFVACTVSYMGYTFAMGALSYWWPTLMQRKYGITAGEAGIVFGVLVIVTGILGTLAGGKLTDRFQERWPDVGVWLSGVTLLASAPVVAWTLATATISRAYVGVFIALLLLFVNTSPVNALLVSSLPAGIRATGLAFSVLFVHLFGDAISPELVGRRSDALGGTGDALARALRFVVPALVLSGAALWWARTRPRGRQRATQPPTIGRMLVRLRSIMKIGEHELRGGAKANLESIFVGHERGCVRHAVHVFTGIRHSQKIK